MSLIVPTAPELDRERREQQPAAPSPLSSGRLLHFKAAHLEVHQPLSPVLPLLACKQHVCTAGRRARQSCRIRCCACSRCWQTCARQGEGMPLQAWRRSLQPCGTCSRLSGCRPCGDAWTSLLSCRQRSALWHHLPTLVSLPSPC